MTDSQKRDRLALACQVMAICTLFFMLALNAAAWIFPASANHGLVFSLTGSMIENLSVDIYAFPWWQTAGAIILSSLPLLALAFGLHGLFNLFRMYARRSYFSKEATSYLGRTGKMVMLWVILSIICEPLLSVWITMQEPEGYRIIRVSVTTGYIVALFLASSVSIIAHILKKASSVYAENEMFV